jgi:hypothetical protein
MTRGQLALSVAALSLFASVPGRAQKAAKHPDFSGTWNSATATPLERPAQLKDKEFFTPAEAAEYEKRSAARNEDQPFDPKSANVGTYNVAFREFGSHVVKTLRTSIVTDPPDGRIPALTTAAAAAKRARQQRLDHPDGSTDTGLQDQCIIFPTSVPPMIPYSYNSNYQILQTGDTLMIQAEMIHDTRIIRLDGSPHIPASVRLWMGDSVGHWEGATLVVDTTNYNDGNGYYGAAGGVFGWDRNLHVVERFSFLDPETILYRFEVDDPSAYTRPWKGELTMSRSTAPMYEYACHEGNYALPDLLKGFRADEAAAAAKQHE